MSNESYLTIETSGETGILTITIDRHGNSKNQIDTGMLVALREALLPELSQPSCNGIVLCSAREKVFSLGADIDGELKDLGAYQAARFCAAGKEAFELLSRVPCPTIALLSGFTLGGGLELAMCCDFRIAARNARLGLPEINLAIIPGWGGTQRLQRLIGRSRALQMILTGDPINAATALEYGLLNNVVEGFGDLRPAAEKLLRKLAGKSRTAIALAKRAVNDGGNMSLRDGLALESEIFGLAWSTDDRLEGIAAYRDKRKPKWQQ